MILRTANQSVTLQTSFLLLVGKFQILDQSFPNFGTPHLIPLQLMCQQRSGDLGSLAGEGMFTHLSVFLHVNMMPSAVIVAGKGLWVTLVAPVSIACFFLTIGLVEAFVAGLGC